MLSGWLGHRLPIPDGPAGIWLGVFTLMGQMAVAQGVEKAGGSLQLLEGAMLLTGAFLIIIGLTGWMTKLLKLFHTTCEWCLLDHSRLPVEWNVPKRDDGS